MEFRKSAIIFAAIAALSVMSSCDKYDIWGVIGSTSENVEARFPQSMQWNEEHGYSSLKVDDDNYKLYVFTDPHLYDDGSFLKQFVGAYCADTDAAPFVICLGDLIDGKNRFDTFIDICSPIMEKDTVFYTVGNHDLYHGQWPDYRERFHTSTYWFDVETPSGEKDLYISVDSGNGTLGKNQKIWLEEVLDQKYKDYRNVIVMTHTHFFMTDYSQRTTGNFTMDETYDITALFAQYGVDMVLTGHDHHKDDTTFKGVRYIIVDALKDGRYATFNIGEKISVENISLN